MSPLIRAAFIAFTLILFWDQSAKAQGCSDAGICSIEKMKPGGDMIDVVNQVRTGIGYGNADHGIRVVAPYIAYSRKINNWTIESRLTSIAQLGNEASVFGLSDLYVIGNYEISKNFQASLGFKIPLMDGDRRIDGQALPMDYQSSLGTVDLLLGALYKIKKLEIAVAYQQPLSANKNTFLVEDFPTESPFNKFQSTNNYVRSGDLLMRFSYPINVGQSFRITPSLLPIYHLGNDKFTNAISEEEEIIGSQGLTLNANIFLDFPVGPSSNLQFNMGAPLIVRDARPDGLTRHFVLNLEYRINF